MQGSLLFSHPTIGLGIISYLPPIDYMMLRKSIPTIWRRSSCYPLPYEHTMEAYKRYVKLYADDQTHLITMLDHYVLSGGFLLAVLTGARVLPIQDLDFYNTDLILDTLLPEPFVRNNDTLTGEPDLWEYYASLAEIRCIDAYDGGNRKIQIISAPPKVFNQFDLDICRISLGMGRLRITNPIGIAARMTIAQPWKLFLPCYDTFAIAGEVKLHKGRMAKYIRRGYDICFELWNDAREMHWPMIPDHITALRTQLHRLKMDTWLCGGIDFEKHSRLCGECDDCIHTASIYRERIINYWKQQWLKDSEPCGPGLYRLKFEYINPVPT